jgi:hypothetical protein
MANRAREFQFDVFLSHSAKDETVVRRPAERMQPAGLRVWFDGIIRPGGRHLSPARRVTFA